MKLNDSSVLPSFALEFSSIGSSFIPPVPMFEGNQHLSMATRVIEGICSMSLGLEDNHVKF